jgi:hypothetical protein
MLSIANNLSHKYFQTALFGFVQQALKGVLMNKLYISIIVSILFFGCAAYVTSEGTYLEPLPTTVVIGSPAVVPPPPGIIVRPLPPVVLYPDRHIYFHGGLYYYFWMGDGFTVTGIEVLGIDFTKSSIHRALGDINLTVQRTFRGYVLDFLSQHQPIT